MLPRATISMHSLNENLFPHLTDFSRPQQLVLLERALNVTAQPKYKVIPKVMMSRVFSFLLKWNFHKVMLSQS